MYINTFKSIPFDKKEKRGKMNKRILLFSPLEDFLINPKEFPPLGILYLSSYLKRNGHEVDVIHGNPEDITAFYDFYGISSSTPPIP